MSDIVSEIKYRSGLITIWADEDVENPIDDCFSKTEVMLVSWHRRRGTNHGLADLHAAEAYAKENNMIVKPVRAYEHGNIAFTLTKAGSYPYNDKYDSGWYGVLLVSEEYEKSAESIMSTYEKWANGDTYGYTVKAEGIEESCGGFYGTTDAFLAAKEHLDKDGDILYAAHRLLDSVWTLAYRQVEEHAIEIVTYDRDNLIGYERERELPIVGLAEQTVDGKPRIVVGAHFCEYKPFTYSPSSNDQYFRVVNPQYVFSYEQKAEQSSNA